MSKRVKQDVLVVFDTNLGKLFVKVEKQKKSLLIDVDEIAKDYLQEVNDSIKRYQKTGDAADPVQYSSLTEARVFRHITFELNKYFKVELKQKIAAENMFAILVLVQKFESGKANLSITNIQMMGVLKQFFSGAKGIMEEITETKPEYNIEIIGKNAKQASKELIKNEN